MRRVSLLLLFFVVSCNGLKSFSTIPDPIISADSLTPFHLVLLSGDERVTKYEISVYQKGGRYFAENISPVFYVGGKVDGNWTVGLDSKKIQACKVFIDKAMTLPKKCDDPLTSSVSDYKIAIGKDTINIEGNCDWGGLDFFRLRDILFQEKFSQLKLKREIEIKNLNSKLNGKWYFPSTSRVPKKDQIFILTRSKTINSDCSWEFGTNSSFSNFCKGVPDFSHSKKYNWDIDEGAVYLEIEAGFTEDHAGNTTVANDGATFILDTLNDSTLVLKYLW